MLVRIVKIFKSKSLIYITKCEPTCLHQFLDCFANNSHVPHYFSVFFLGWSRGNLPLPPCCVACGGMSHLLSACFWGTLHFWGAKVNETGLEGCPEDHQTLCAHGSPSACPSGGVGPQDTVLPPETLLWPPANMLRHQCYFITVNAKHYHVLIVT